MTGNRAALTELPPEVLDNIFCLLRPDLSRIVQLASVCRLFRRVAYNIPTAVHLPLSDDKINVLTANKVPVSQLVNRDPAMFVSHQIYALNLKRLVTAELEAADYLTNTPELSPHYVDLLTHVVKNASKSLKHLVANADLVAYQNGSFRCAEVILILQTFPCPPVQLYTIVYFFMSDPFFDIYVVVVMHR
jgi:hypothetical protein